MPFFLKIDDGIIFNLKEIIKENKNSKRKAILITDKTIKKLYGNIVYEQLKVIFKNVEKKMINDNLLDFNFAVMIFVINFWGILAKLNDFTDIRWIES